MNEKKIVIFASGGGSNAETIVNYFQKKDQVKIASFFVNNSQAYAIERAKNIEIPCVVFNKEQFGNGYILEMLNEIEPDLIILAGFLWLIPKNIIDKYQNKIINIHPALLPKYGGKGMHGMNVHTAVKENGETESGITIHFVNEKYDEGNIIFQEKCTISQNDTPEDIAKRVLELEHKHFPIEIDKLLNL